MLHAINRDEECVEDEFGDAPMPAPSMGTLAVSSNRVPLGLAAPERERLVLSLPEG